MDSKIKIKEIGIFHTPKSQDELMNWIDNLSGAEKIVALTTYGMTWNFLASTINGAQKDDDAED